MKTITEYCLLPVIFIYPRSRESGLRMQCFLLWDFKYRCQDDKSLISINTGQLTPIPPPLSRCMYKRPACY